MNEVNSIEKHVLSSDWTDFKRCFWEINLKTLKVKVDDNHINDLAKSGLSDFKSELNLLEFVQFFVDKEDVNKLKRICNKANEIGDKEFETRALIRFENDSKFEIPYLVNFVKVGSDTLNCYAQNILHLSNDLQFNNDTPTLRMVLENTDDNIFLISSDYILLDYNDVFEDISSRYLNKFIKRGMSFSEFIPEIMHDEFKSCVDKAFQKESSFVETTYFVNEEFHIEATVNPIIKNDVVLAASIFVKNVTEYRQTKRIDKLENLILEQAVRYEEAESVIYTLLTGMEEIAPDLICYVTKKRVDEMFLDWYSSIRIPESYLQALPEIKIAENVVSCGAAAYSHKTVFTSSIASSTNWTLIRDITLLQGFKSCFSFPIINRNGEVLGTIGAYLKVERDLDQLEYLLLQRGVKLSGIILEKEIFQEEILKQEVKIKEIGSLIPGVLYKAESDLQGNRRFTYLSEKFRDFFGVEPDEFYLDYANIWKYVHPDDIDAVAKSIDASIANASDWKSEFRVFNIDKQEYFWVRASSSRIVSSDGKNSTYGSFTDITDLKVKESQLNAIIASIDDVVFLFTNDSVCRNLWSRDPLKLGKDRDWCINKKYIEIFGFEKNLLFQEALTHLKSEGDTYEYNCSMEINSKMVFYRARVGKLKFSLDEDQIYYTVKDVTDIRESQLESARLSDILQVAGNLGKVGAFEYNIQSKAVIWSDELFAIFEADKKLKGKDLYDYYISMLHPDDRTIQPLRLAEAINSDKPYENEHRIVMDDGSIKWIVSISKVIVDEDGAPLLLRGVTQDISDRKRVESKLRKSDQLAKDAGTLGKIGGWEFDIPNNLFSVTEQIYSIYDFSSDSPSDERRSQLLSSVHPDDIELLNQKFENAIVEGIDFESEHRVVQKDGSIKWAYGKAVVYKDQHNKPIRIQGVCQDVTERKSEHSEREKERTLLRQAGELGKLGGWSLDFRSNLVNWTDQIFKIFEVDPYIKQEEIYTKYVECLHPDDTDELFRLITLLKNTKTPFSYTHRIILPGNRLKYLYCKGDPVMEGNEVVGINGIVQEITDQKITEFELEKNRKLLEVIALASVKLQSEFNQDKAVFDLLEQIGIAVEVNRVYVFKTHLDNTSNLPLMSQVYEWTDGNTSIEINNPRFQNISFESLEISDWYEQFQKGLPIAGKVSEFNERVQDLLISQDIKSILIVPVIVDGLQWGYFGFDECKRERTWTDAEISLLTSASGIIGNAIKRFAIQSELDQSELKYSSIVDSMKDGVIIYDSNYSVIAANKSAYSILEIDSMDIINETSESDSVKICREDMSVLLPEEFPSYIAFKEGKRIENMVLGFCKADAPIKWILATAIPINLANSNVNSGVITTFTDVTDKLKTERELKKVSLVAQKTSNAVLIVAANRLIEWVNDGFVSTFGYSNVEVINKRISDVLFNENTSSDILDYIMEKVESNQSFDVEIIVKKKSNKEFWVKMEMQPVFDNNKVLMNYVVILTDIDSTKITEQIINQNLREKEVLLAEIHHRVKNNLAIVSSLLQLQLLHTNDESSIHLIKESQSRLKSMALVHEKLYEGGDLSSVNFSNYITEIASHIKQVYPNPNVDIEFSSISNNVMLDISIAVPCGLIINELLTNAIKYAFVGEKSGIVYVSFEQNGDYYTLEVTDNGVGISKPIDFKNLTSLGLTLVNTLVTQLKGSLNYKLKNGSQFIITFPRSKN